jgi:hypothetical protein
MGWTTADLLASVRREGFLPDAHDLSSSDLLAFADEELATILAEVWKTSREERRVVTADLPLAPGVNRYRTPRRALAGGVRGVTYVDASGAEGPADEISPMDVWRWQSAMVFSGFHYYFEGDELVLPVAPSSAGGAIRVRYYERPPRLIEPDDAAPITNATSTTTLALANAPGSSIATAGAFVDIVRGDSPFETRYADRISAGYAGGVLTLNASTPIAVSEISDRTGGAAFGARTDYVCPRDCTVYPPIPQELHPVLVSAVLRRAAESQLDQSGASLAEASLRRRITAATNIAEPRNADRKPRIVARGGALRGRGQWRGGWG